MHELEVFLALSVVLLAALLLGELMRRIGQPALLGEILAGVLLGPYVLGLVESEGMFEFLAKVGAMLLLFAAGYEEVELEKLLGYGRAAFVIALAGMILSFSLGYVIGVAFGYGVLAKLFLGLALSISSIGVTARVLMDLGQMNTEHGTTILGAAVIDDILGLMFLSVVVGLVNPGMVLSVVSVGLIIAKVVLFFIGAVLFERFILRPIDRMGTAFDTDNAHFLLLLVIFFGAGLLAEVAGLDAIIGAFVAGVIVSREPGFTTAAMQNRVEGIGLGFLIPIFFASIGAQVDLSAVVSAGLLAALVVGAAFVGKIVGGYFASRVMGFGHIKGLVMGWGAVPRTGVELVIASIGLSTGVIDQEIFVSIVAIVATTVLIVPPVLQGLLTQLGEEAEERQVKKSLAATEE